MTPKMQEKLLRLIEQNALEIGFETQDGDVTVPISEECIDGFKKLFGDIDVDEYDLHLCWIDDSSIITDVGKSGRRIVAIMVAAEGTAEMYRMDHRKGHEVGLDGRGEGLQSPSGRQVEEWIRWALELDEQ